MICEVAVSAPRVVGSPRLGLVHATVAGRAGGEGALYYSNIVNRSLRTLLTAADFRFRFYNLVLNSAISWNSFQTYFIPFLLL